MAKQNFGFYCSTKKGGTSLELYELSMVLSACGYKIAPELLNELNLFLTQRKGSGRLDFNAL